MNTIHFSIVPSNIQERVNKLVNISKLMKFGQEERQLSNQNQSRQLQLFDRFSKTTREKRSIPLEIKKAVYFLDQEVFLVVFQLLQHT